MKRTSTPPLAPNLMADAGVFFVQALRDLAQDTKATESIRNDWAIIKAWLRSNDNELSPDHLEMIFRAWRAYLAIGLAPSHELQPLFDSIKALFGGGDYRHDRPPVEIMDAFDRMLANTEQIKTKRASDVKAEGEKLAKIIGRLPGKRKQGGLWSRQSRTLRGWIFVSVAWAAIALFIIAVFNPLEVWNWERAEGRDYLKAMAIMFLPAVAGLLKAAYRKATG